MALTQKLDMRQGQSLVMTPQLQQAIKLLQMSNFELQEYVESELEKNPLLEKDDALDVSGSGAAPAAETSDAEILPSGNAVSATLETLGTDIGNVYADEAKADRDDRTRTQGLEASWAGLGATGRPGSFDQDSINFENILPEKPTLREFLIQQLNLAMDDPKKRLIGSHLIGTVNEAGYLQADLEQTAQSLGACVDEVEDVLAILQTFDPPGVCARDLKECLRQQLVEKNRYDPAMAALVEHLELLAKHDFRALARLCGVPLEEIQDMVTEIRQLDPRPGNAFGDTVVHPVVPDVIVSAAQDGTWNVELNTDTLPRVLVNNQYYATVARGAASEEDKVYISQCHSNANWLVKSLEQRARTILAVSREIVRQQDAFLVDGVRALKPLNLRTVADAIDMHESTVSRVTSNKYMQTPRGIFELKYFFTTAISSTGGDEEYSSEAIRHRIRELIDNEPANKVLSDDMIVEALRQTGVEIARRTVAKYREAMRIPSSIQRRREKKAAAGK